MEHQPGPSIPGDTLALELVGRNLTGATFGDQLEGLTLITFIRHFG